MLHPTHLSKAELAIIPVDDVDVSIPNFACGGYPIAKVRNNRSGTTGKEIPDDLNEAYFQSQIKTVNKECSIEYKKHSCGTLRATQ
ncbi:hypothetical protein VNO77_33350 [Canavalia gladiata]|uniref:Uncharacterized protein n=1 Tax=Canavalia gladiata TaxID=3824 RepID=A0AAN9PY96_CANGL